MLATGYPVLLFPAPDNEPSTDSTPYGVCTTAMHSLADLKSIISAPSETLQKSGVQYSLLMTFKRPSAEALSAAIEGLKTPGNILQSLSSFPESLLSSPEFWVEMQMTAANGHKTANITMPAGMGEAAAQKNPQRDFTSLLLGQCLSGLYRTSMDAVGLPDMRCVNPLAEVRVRDIVQYRNLKLALKQVGMDNIAVRCDSVQSPTRKEYLSEPILAFCAICFKLSTAHKRCGGCKVAHYCSTECQKQDWLELHKSECKIAQKDQKEWEGALASQM
ncbi:hypothetical protein P389DRAFT_194744 [Cystobasidium minutum MCA 4210]|uniref:uncharacterized protein n=1 Tax=Cystobasidium minutum MCA 4210 TaxID=1397322 RepID=UPI0034CF2681|eukprot:jgi/Rhomi1/194744/gm1.2958_g